MFKIKKFRSIIQILWDSLLYLAYCGCCLMIALYSIDLFFKFVTWVSSYDKVAMQSVFSTFYVSYVQWLWESEWTLDFFIDICKLFLGQNSTYIHLIIVFIVLLLAPIKEGIVEIGFKKIWFYATILALIVSFF